MPVLGPRSVLLLEGAEHLARRRLMLPAFHGERMRSYEGIVREAAERQIASWPQRVRDYAVETTAVNLLDWASAYGFAPTPSLLANMMTPTLVVRGENSHAAVKRANELLGQSIPGATFATVPGAAHFMIATHASELADLIASHVGIASHIGHATHASQAAS